MSGLCSCTTEDLLRIPSGLCISEFRRDTPARPFFYPCDLSLPTGSFDAVGAAMKVLIDAGTIVAAPPFANFAANEPTYDQLQLTDCNAPQELIATRTFTFEDRTKIDIGSVSPFTNNEYFDYDFWNDIIEKQNNLRCMLGYCSGDVRILDIPFTIRIFLDYLRSGTAGGKSTEVKKAQMNFQGDPLNLTVKPTFNYISAGIVI